MLIRMSTVGCFLKFFKIEIQLIYNVVLTFAIQQSDSVIHTYIHSFLKAV